MEKNLSYHNFYHGLCYVGVSHLATAADFAPIDMTKAGPGERALLVSTFKGAFLFRPFLIDSSKRVAILNCKNQREFFMLNGERRVNRSYWSANLVIKNRRDGGSFRVLELAVVIPPWTIAEQFVEEHLEAMEWMAGGGGVALEDGKSLYLSLKDEYATVFLSQITQHFVAGARLSGWQPLFLIKNAIVYYSKQFGINGYQLSTINKNPRSFLLLVGFFRGSGENLQVIALKDETGRFMVTRRRAG